MKILGIIPARYASSRFPGKSLADLRGKSMIHRVYEQAVKATLLDEVVVATDDERIFSHCESIGAQVIMTGTHHESGTDRCAEVISRYQDYEGVINIQGDEPFIQPAQIDQLARLLEDSKEAHIVTMAKKISEEEELFNENVVKVTFNHRHRALYFSRHPIPFCKNHPQTEWLKQGDYFKHIGLYGYRSPALLAITSITSGQYHRLEMLEQLKWLEHGHDIAVTFTEFETIGIDTPADLIKAQKLFSDES